MFRIKICGITTVEDALAAAEAGADAIGLNFYAGSKRHVTPEQAAEIVSALKETRLVKVGVFVNMRAGKVNDIYDRSKLDMIQLHGLEPIWYVRRLRGRPTIRSFHELQAFFADLQVEVVAEYVRVPPTPKEWTYDMILLDARAPGEFGGTGQTCDWNEASRYRELYPDGPPLVLAGGLTPQNVAEAIATVRPAAVDTASGVESAPWRKDPKLMQAFVAAAREAFARLDTDGASASDRVESR